MSFIAANKVYTSTNKTTVVWIETGLLFFLLFFNQCGCVSCLRTCFGARLLPQSYQYPNLSEGADSVGGQLRGDKEYPFSGVTKSGRVWRKVPESGARSVEQTLPSRCVVSNFPFKPLNELALPGTGQENNTAHPRTVKWLSYPSQFFIV